MLLDNQVEIRNDMYAALNDKLLFNIPTGRGKTYIFLSVAIKCLKDNKKIILSVPNNNLVREMYKTAIEHFCLSEKDVHIVIGADNYISIAKLLLYKNTLEEYITKDSLEKYILFAKSKKVLFFDEFEGIVSYKDSAYSSIVRSLLSLDTKDVKSFESKKGIMITNHFYLLSKATKDIDFELNKYVLLADEVHNFAEIAESILSDSFSIFDFKVYMKNFKNFIKEQEDFYGKLSLIKSLQTLYVKASNLHSNYSIESKVGLYETNADNTKKYLDEIQTLLSNKDSLVVFKKASLYKSSDFENYLKRCMEMNDYLLKRNKKENIAIAIYYSPSRGYPTIKMSTKNIMGKLNYLLWDKVEEFAGASATITSSLDPDKYELKYGYQRLGMLERNKKYSIMYYKRLFPVENIKINLPPISVSLKIDSVFNDDCNENSPYYNYIADYIYQHNNGKNSIVLCAGYKEAKFISELYQKKFLEQNIHVATPSVKTINTLEAFKKKGGVLFATRNYNTGISLKGKLLERLFILKLPYPDYTKKRWLDLKERSKAIFRATMEKEMLIILMQTLGRIQRDKEDKGEIHLLDIKFLRMKDTVKVKKKIYNILKEYGTIVNVKRNVFSDKNIVECNSTLEELLKI